MEQSKIYNPANDSIKSLWLYDRRLDRMLVILQTIFIVTFTFRDKIWGLFVAVAFICFFSLPLIYFSKFAKGHALNKKLRELVAQQKIPQWIPKRRTIIFVSWLIIGHPVFWMFFTIISVEISRALPFILSIILAVPWYLLEHIHRKEEKFLEPYLK
ncbi:MAG: hypothetical protein WCS88_03720 [Patescibacteria group bacterium]|jgi:hypothetical protein